MRDVTRREQPARASSEARRRRKQAEHLPGAERRILEMIALDRPLPEVLDALVRSVEGRADRSLCSVLLLDADGRRLRHGAAPSLPAAYCEAVDGLEIGPRAGSCGTAAYTGERVIVTDIVSDPLWADYRDLAAQFGLRACWSLPIKSGAGKVLGTFAIYYREPRAPSASDLELIERMQHLAGIVLERNRAQGALRESEARFRNLTDLSSDWYWEQDAEFRFTAFSGYGASASASGGDPSVYLGKTRWEISDMELVDGDWAAHRSQLERHEPFRDTMFRRRMNDGTCRYMSVSGEPMFGDDGRFTGYRGVAKNVTARMEAEQALRESEERFQHAVRGSSAGIWDWNIDAGTYYMSPRFKEMLGYSDAEVPNQREFFVASLHPEDRARVDDARRRHFEEREPYEVDYRLRCKDGRYLWCRGVGQAVWDAAGRVVRYSGSTTDIEAHKRAEQRIAQLLAEQETLFENALVGIAFLKERRVVQCNQAFAQMFGYERAELLGLSTRHLHQSEEAYEERGREAYPVVAARGSFTTDAPMRRKDGGQFWVNYRLSPVERGDLGKGVVWVVQDITERKRAEQRLEAHAREQELIAALGRTALGEIAFKDLLAQAVQAGCAMGADAAAVFEHPPASDQWVLRAALGLDSTGVIDAPVEICPGCPVRAATRASEPVVEDDHHGTRCERVHGTWARDMRSSMNVQILGEDCAYGAFAVFSRRPNAFSAEDIKYLQQLGNLLSTAVRRKQMEARLEQLAHFDTLTGLPNRSLLHDRLTQTLAQARRKRGNAAVLFVDLDRFKQVNDTLGHDAGDRLIAQVGERLAHCVRQGDTVGRISGDEFALVLADLTRSEDAAIVAQKVLDDLAAPFGLSEREVYVTASIGVSSFPQDGDNAETLLKNADMAMYRAKKSTRNAYRFFTAKMDQRSMARMQLHEDLRHALERGEFSLHYQPKIDLATGRGCGVEALLRWNHPQRGMVSPAEFIPALEDSGLIVQVGEWVVMTACDQLCAWRDAGAELLPVAVNVSARQFRQPDLGAFIRDYVRGCGLPADLLELEITESLLMEDPEQAVLTLNTLREVGVRISLDDFGTGYSSMSYLMRFPLSALKIDRGFVHGAATDSRSAAIVRAVIELAHRLGFTVIAEGVEQDQDAAFLRQHGCDQAQGYLFGKPVPAAELARGLAQSVSAA